MKPGTQAPLGLGKVTPQLINGFTRHGGRADGTHIRGWGTPPPRCTVPVSRPAFLTVPWVCTLRAEVSAVRLGAACGHGEAPAKP